MNFKYVVVGAGISGLVMAERIANVLGERVLVIDKRNHIGGNCYDYYNEDGLLIHKYGPHIFHTKDPAVFSYLEHFTSFTCYQHKVLTYVDGNLLPMPICVKTINQLFGENLSNREVSAFLDTVREKDREIHTSEDVVLNKAGRVIYEKFFKEYTKKQWDAYPDKLDPSVISRVPIRDTIDDRYFTDPYQGMPKNGYTDMFQRMVDSKNISILLHTDYKAVIDDIEYEYLIYTGPIDYFYDYQFGPLKYRSVRIAFETLDQPSYQEAAVVNFPNDYDFTRITEYKKLTGQVSSKTVISKEYPTWEGEPYYPVPAEEQQALYRKYAGLAEQEKNVFFLGRLAEYRYYNMDAAVASALSLFKSQFLNK